MSITPLAEQCRHFDWLHDRARCRIPLSPHALSKLAIRSSHAENQVYQTSLVEFGIQPLVFSPIPPLMHLLIYGCGCSKCESVRSKEADEVCDKIYAHQIFQFYLTVLMCQALEKARPEKQKGLRTMPSDTVLVEIRKWVYEVMEFQFTQSARTIWERIEDSMQSETGKDEAVRQLALLAASSTQSPDFTLTALHIVEDFVWLDVMRRFGTVDDERQNTIVREKLYHCPPTCVLPMHKWESDKKAADLVADAVLQQCTGLRIVMTGSPTGEILSQWPEFTLPSVSAIQALTTNPSDALVPIQSGVYTLLSFFYMHIISTRKPKVVAHTLTCDAGGEQ